MSRETDRLRDYIVQLVSRKQAVSTSVRARTTGQRDAAEALRTKFMRGEIRMVDRS